MLFKFFAGTETEYLRVLKMSGCYGVYGIFMMDIERLYLALKCNLIYL